MTLPEALAPCPFCGGDSCRVIGGPATRGGPEYWAGCDYCHGRTWGDTEAEAITAWNTRPALAKAGGVRVDDVMLDRACVAPIPEDVRVRYGYRPGMTVVAFVGEGEKGDARLVVRAALEAALNKEAGT